MGASSGHELLEHTADVGVRAWGATPAEAFRQAALGVAEVAGVRREGSGRARRLAAEGVDPGALLVAFLNELVFLIETEGAGIGDVRVSRLTERDLEAEVELVPIEEPSAGVTVKAATYHQLAVETRPDGTAEVRVYLDV